MSFHSPTGSCLRRASVNLSHSSGKRPTRISLGAKLVNQLDSLIPDQHIDSLSKLAHRDDATRNGLTTLIDLNYYETQTELLCSRKKN